jgi:two-component system, OmpR family, alkaline phosphatase synthesis response regulator PhoP
MTELLLVDEDSQRRIELWDRLVEEGYRVHMASEAREALARALSSGIDLVVLDVTLRDGDGVALCQELRQRGFEGAVVLLTDADRASDRVLGLKLGADDVLTRPFELMELVARIEACLRRGPALAATPATQRFGEIELDLRGSRVLKAGQPVPMTPREFKLLRCLAEKAGTPVSRAQLLDSAWGRDSMPSPQTVDVHVAWLRRKLERDPARPTLIRTVHGVGYVLSVPR